MSVKEMGELGQQWPSPSLVQARANQRLRPVKGARAAFRKWMDNLRARADALVERVRKTLPARVLTAYGESRASNYALALAFAGFMSMFPMILGALSLIGLAIRHPATEANFQSLVVQAFPYSAQPEILNALEGVKRSAGWLGLVSIGGLAWSASSIFAAMEFALAEIFGTRQRDVFRQRLMGLVMMVVLIAAIVATFGINALAALVPVPPVGAISSFVVGSAAMVLLLIALYRFVPNRTFRLRDLVPGALLAGVCIEVVSLAFPLYARVAGGFNTYGAQFALFFLLGAWFYLLSQLILLGAVYNRFRLGEPAMHGLIASPMRDSRNKVRPVDSIEQKR
jgi:membrane protein